MSTGEVARRLGVVPDTVLKWIKQGRLRAERTAGGHHRIDAADLEHLEMPLHCWEFFSSGGNACGKPCKNCPFYQQFKGQPTRVLVVTVDDGLQQRLSEDLPDHLALRFSGSVQAGAQAMGEFLPQFVFIDAPLKEQWEGLTPRVSFPAMDGWELADLLDAMKTPQNVA